MAIVEICAEGLSAALAAEEGGADRVELCENLAVGGVTPSAGTIAVARRRLGIPIRVLIRPRGGDFVYSDAEFAAMEHDVLTAKALGIEGVVLGVLRRDRTIDRGRTARLIDRAHPLPVTFHKAFDEIPDPAGGLSILTGLGIDRVLTSGGAATAIEGLSRLVDLDRRAGGRPIILAGGRIRPADIPHLIGAGLSEIHIGSAACVGGRVAAERVRELVALARVAAPSR